MPALAGLWLELALPGLAAAESVERSETFIRQPSESGNRLL